MNDYSISGKNSTITYNFTADKVFLVMRPGKNKEAFVKLFLDGKEIDSGYAGIDVKGEWYPLLKIDYII